MILFKFTVFYIQINIEIASLEMCWWAVENVEWNTSGAKRVIDSPGSSYCTVRNTFIYSWCFN